MEADRSALVSTINVRFVVASFTSGVVVVWFRPSVFTVIDVFAVTTVIVVFSLPALDETLTISPTAKPLVSVILSAMFEPAAGSLV